MDIVYELKIKSEKVASRDNHKHEEMIMFSDLEKAYNHFYYNRSESCQVVLKDNTLEDSEIKYFGIYLDDEDGSLVTVSIISRIVY